jgi:phosphatidylserine decarboxylase precursor
MQLRPIKDKESSENLCSPCDGKILSISKVENLDELIIVKNRKYSLSEFLFGIHKESYSKLVEPILDNSKDYYQITIYLSPADCHRYFSPNNFHIHHRIYLPGFLEPVRPNYLNKHQDTLLTNERVTLIGDVEGSRHKVYMTMVGALNVGSINISFDDFLKTNQSLITTTPQDSGNFVVNYSDIINPSSSTQENFEFIYYKPSIPLLLKELENDTSEFDIRDMINIDINVEEKQNVEIDKSIQSNLSYSKIKEILIMNKLKTGIEDLPHTIFNNFNTMNLNSFKTMKKLNSPKSLSIENYKVSNKGVFLSKGEEIGWFNFGSTIVLVFSVDSKQKLKFNYSAGDRVQIGQDLYNLIKI